jgi:glycosyltransferase involved in cell wall biosynthesis
MTTYNAANTVARALLSVKAQTYSNWSAVIVDDGSTDDTAAVVRSLIDPGRIELICLPRVGVSKALNVGIEAAQGRWIARLDADDECLPNRLERQMEYLSAHPEVKLLGSAYYWVDTDNGWHKVRMHPATDREIRLALGLCIPFCHSSIVIERDALIKCGGYDPKLERLVDYDLYTRFCRDQISANLQEPLVRHYKYRSSYFASHSSRLEKAISTLRLNWRAQRQLHLPKYFVLLSLARFGYYFLPHGVKGVVRFKSSRLLASVFAKSCEWEK